MKEALGKCKEFCYPNSSSVLEVSLFVSSRGQHQRRQWHPTPVLLPGKSHGWRSLVGCSPWGHEESDMTERLHFHFSLSCIGEGNGNPLQCSCLENPRDGGDWWAAISGVAQSRTRLKQLSSRGQHCGCEQTSWSHRRPSLDTRSIDTLEVWWQVGGGGQMNWEIGDQHIYTLTLSYLGN